MNRNELIVQVLNDLNAASPDDDWSRADVKNCLAAIEAAITDNLSRGEAVNLSGFVKLYSRATPAKPARDGINPFTKEPMRFAAKPASLTIKATPLKALKDTVAAAAKKGKKKR
ncbi:MAG TPA: HU family DNA-binding protein [Acidimicrobiales bacterium]|jgi:DNA-binding protein HU-beta|nr:HU family DNA-binding protein [Acidimicrobiales bacterium]